MCVIVSLPCPTPPPPPISTQPLSNLFATSLQPLIIDSPPLLTHSTSFPPLINLISTPYHRFATGCSRLPVGGFSALSPPFTINITTPFMASRALPTAATCFNMLRLPRYHNHQSTPQATLTPTD